MNLKKVKIQNAIYHLKELVAIDSSDAENESYSLFEEELYKNNWNFAFFVAPLTASLRARKILVVKKEHDYNVFVNRQNLYLEWQKIMQDLDFTILDIDSHNPNT